eukprot:5340250-Ditylum_brightwellii.AAC.1
MQWNHCIPRRILNNCGTKAKLLICILEVAPVLVQRRTWRNKGRMNSHIQKACYKIPGKGASADHIISHELGPIPQAIGK